MNKNTLNQKNILWSATEAAVVTGGKTAHDWFATGVSLNIDDINPGDLFVASREDNLEHVFAKGAVAAMVPGTHPCDIDFPILQVGNTFEALQNLAQAARFKTHALMISVQGLEARHNMAAMLGSGTNVFCAGRHLSLSLANMPEDSDFGVFPSSPAVRPDIAVITNCAKSNRDTLFEAMPVSGIAIINADDINAPHIRAAAKAAGIQTVLSYGHKQSADARYKTILCAENGTRIDTNIMGEEFSIYCENTFDANPLWLAAMLVYRLAGISPESLFSDVSKPVPSNGLTPQDTKKNALRLLDPHISERASNMNKSIFRVQSMIDLGRGNQTAVLDNILKQNRRVLSGYSKSLTTPGKLDNLNLLYASKGGSSAQNPRNVIRENQNHKDVKPIVTDILAPGDFVVFRQIWNSSRAVFSEALRPVRTTRKTANKRTDYAL